MGEVYKIQSLMENQWKKSVGRSTPLSEIIVPKNTIMPMKKLFLKIGGLRNRMRELLASRDRSRNFRRGM